MTKEQLITIENGDNVPICGSRNITLDLSIIVKNVYKKNQSF